MRKFPFYLAFLCLFSAFLFGDLIPRERFFQKQPCLKIKISPDSKRLAYVSLDAKGTMNLYVSPELTLDKGEQITDFQEPSIKGFYWLPDNQHILCLKDKDGTSQFCLFLIDLNNKNIQDLTGQYNTESLKINAKVFALSEKNCQAVVGLNNRDPKFHDLYLWDLNKKELSLIEQNEQFLHFIFDSKLNVVAKVRLNSDASLTLVNQENQKVFDICSEDAFHTEFLQFNDQESCLYLIDNRNCNTTQLKKIYFDTSKPDSVIGQDALNLSDINDVYFENNQPILYSTCYAYKEWHSLSSKSKTDIEFLISRLGVNFSISDQSIDGNFWIVKSDKSDQGIEFWVYNRLSKSLNSLYQFPQIDNLSKTYDLNITARDGLKLVCYLTLPRDKDFNGTTQELLPLVVFPHGGPFKCRDYDEYSSYVQWLANRGYAVLTVNFRLSSGFGKAFVNAGNGQWGKKAHEDLLDAVQYCIDHKFADAKRIGIFGGSYGGYAALAGLTFSPKFFACSIAICGPSSLKTVLDGVPMYWEFPVEPLSDQMVTFTKYAFVRSMGGDPNTEEGIRYLKDCSPLEHLDKIQTPLLLIHGETDHIVKIGETNQIFDAMAAKQLPVISITFAKEGHGIMETMNKDCYLAFSEWLLARYLGGAYEPLQKETLKASTATIKASKLDPEAVFK